MFVSCFTDVPQNTYNTKQYNLESAEGCYSMVVMMSQDTKVKYAVKVRGLKINVCFCVFLTARFCNVKYTDW